MIVYIYIYTVYGWCYSYPSEKYEFVSWDDDIPNIYIYIWKVIKFMFQTTNQISTLWLFNIAMGNGP